MCWSTALFVNRSFFAHRLLPSLLRKVCEGLRRARSQACDSRMGCDRAAAEGECNMGACCVLACIRCSCCWHGNCKRCPSCTLYAFRSLFLRDGLTLTVRVEPNTLLDSGLWTGKLFVACLRVKVWKFTQLPQYECTAVEVDIPAGTCRAIAFDACCSFLLFRFALCTASVPEVSTALLSIGE